MSRPASAGVVGPVGIINIPLHEEHQWISCVIPVLYVPNGISRQQRHELAHDSIGWLAVWTSNMRLLRSISRARQHVALLSARAFSGHAGKVDRQYLSLYNYTPLDQDFLPKLRQQLLKDWRALDVLGRIYISLEGINAQLIVPAKNVSAFARSAPSLFTHENLNFGQLIKRDDALEPFDKLDIRMREQIVRDGLEHGTLDLQNSGHALPASEWHTRLQQRNASADSSTLVLDVRNFYEHEIGRFDGATRIMVDTFRDTFEAVDEILESHKAEHDGRPPSEVMMYCTGGIRCEKVGAYLRQHKEISNVQKLQGGIVSYMKFLKDQEVPDSLFKGKNFVFDQRCVTNESSGEEVTPDVLGACFQCGEPCHQYTNCSNLMCHGLVLQCSTCAQQFLGACSQRCTDEVVKMEAMTPEQQREHRKKNSATWRKANPNAPAPQRFIKFRPVPPQALASRT